VRAVAIRDFGGTPELMELPEPAPGRGEVEIRLHVAGVNPFDWKIADGILRKRPHVFPLVLGVDGAGEVARSGDGAARFREGDRICGQFLHDPVGVGTYAEFATVPESIGVARIPQGVGFAAAAAIPTAGMTALDAIDFLAPTPGSSLLIVGASGGVGSYAVQLAAARGARVIGTARGGSPDRLRALGAELVIDPERGDLAELVHSVHPAPVDALLDLGSDRARFAQLTTLVRDGGAAATTVYAADVEELARRGIRGRNLDLQPRKELLEPLLEMVARGRLAVPISREVPIVEAPLALADSRARGSVGKTVIRIRSDAG